MREFSTWQEYLKWLQDTLPVFTQALALSREASASHHRTHHEHLGRSTPLDPSSVSTALSRFDASFQLANITIDRMNSFNTRMETEYKEMEALCQGIQQDIETNQRKTAEAREKIRMIQLQTQEKDKENQQKAIEIAEKETKLQEIRDKKTQILQKIETIQTQQKEKIRELEESTRKIEAKSTAISGEAGKLTALIQKTTTEMPILQAEIETQSILNSENDKKSAIFRAELEKQNLEIEAKTSETRKIEKNTENCTRKSLSLLLEMDTAMDLLKKSSEERVKEAKALSDQETCIEEMAGQEDALWNDYLRRLKTVAACFRKRTVIQNWHCSAVELKEVRLRREQLEGEEEMYRKQVWEDLEEQRKKEKGKKKSKKKAKKMSLPAKLAEKMSQELETVNAEFVVTSFRKMDRK